MRTVATTLAVVAQVLAPISAAQSQAPPPSARASGSAPPRVPSTDPIAERDRLNLAGWRVLGFTCDLANRPTPLAVRLCDMVGRQVRQVAARGRTEVREFRTPQEFGYEAARGLPFLVVRISTSPGGGLEAVSVNLRAQQHYAGPVPTRTSPGTDGLESIAPVRRSGDLVMWETSLVGTADQNSGEAELRVLEDAVGSMVQSFFLALYSARR